MIQFVVNVDADLSAAIAIKECFAMYLEKFGDAKIIAVNTLPDQLNVWDKHGLDK